MKKLSFLLGFLNLFLIHSVALDLVLCDFDDVEPANTIGITLGAEFSEVNNTVTDGINTSAQCGQFNNTPIPKASNWTSSAVIPVTPFTIPESGICFISIMVKYPAVADIGLRLQNNKAELKEGIAANQTTVRPTPLYNGNNLDQWQELVFDIGSVFAAGQTIDTLNFLGDMYWNSGQAYKTSSALPGFFDEIRVYDIQIPEHINMDLCDFESGQTATPSFGATTAVVSNPSVDSKNGTAQSVQAGRTSSNWWELIDIEVEDFMVPTSEKCYVHVLVKSSVPLDIVLRPMPSNSPDVRATTPYAADGEWQDLVFDIAANKEVGFLMTEIRLITDVAKVLDNASVFAYFDEIIVNEDPRPRTLVSGPAEIDTTLSTFEDETIYWSTTGGASIERIINTDNSGASINASNYCVKLGDNKTTAYALIDHNTAFTLPESNCYLHVMAKSNVSPEISIRTMPDNTTDIKPIDSLVGNNQWQDLIFDLKQNKFSGYDVSHLRMMLDFYGFNLNTTDSVLYIDEVIINTSATPRVAVPTYLEDKSLSSAVKIFPNPAKDRLYITGDNVAQVSVYNVVGQQVLHSPMIKNHIDVKTLEQGIFILNCKDENGVTLTNKTFFKN